MSTVPESPMYAYTYMAICEHCITAINTMAYGLGRLCEFPVFEVVRLNEAQRRITEQERFLRRVAHSSPPLAGAGQFSRANFSSKDRPLRTSSETEPISR